MIDYDSADSYDEKDKGFRVHDFDPDNEPHVLVSPERGEVTIYIKDWQGKVHEFHFDGCKIKVVE